ncbi:hypothetical protein JQ607_08955 [Bradyrhizobium liaoningense]|uniref:hypothetical protein n=1 Tax=Bradyrhizobium liaoningense TaxID=43992 RepID=UPI001BA620EC|nr:hypothetical protein [Bradyrhizobium liaoningense]MBR0840323.1 hypothetical protein [Bradyrhizobium liaoningense]
MKAELQELRYAILDQSTASHLKQRQIGGPLFFPDETNVIGLLQRGQSGIELVRDIGGYSGIAPYRRERLHRDDIGTFDAGRSANAMTSCRAA